MKLNKKLRILVSAMLATSMLASCGIHAGDKDGAGKEGEWKQVYTQDPNETDPIENPEKVIGEDGVNPDALYGNKDEEESKSESKENGDNEGKEEKVEDKEASIIMVGDMLLHQVVSESGQKDDGTYNYDPFFEHVKDDVAAADLAIINEEVILGGPDIGISGYPCFNALYEVGDAIVKAGFDVVLHATNHALDQGKTGLNNCINFWKEHYPDITYTGIYQSQEEQDKICVVEVNKIKIAILNYTYGTNGIPLPDDMPYAVNLLDEEKIRKDVAAAKEQADFVIVCPHWGTEYTLEETEEQKNWCKLFLELDVDLVLGAHPHVVEPVEWYEGEDGHKMLVYYSLGNFINGTSSTESHVGWRYVGAMAKVTIGTDDKGQVVIKDYGVEPLVTQKEKGYGKITTYKLSDYTQELADNNMARNYDSNFSLQFCKDTCKEVFKDLYKED